ncbi:hypothetical protein [Cryptosporangium aurantiacum]|uniref:hypothetical protein n=1 Tax=Cryptosporangium aurantiacum TaxID=134849 RepID=UPI001160EE87|nr:hypothetical protein [Cryptosporangium aurantiacum]
MADTVGAAFPRLFGLARAIDSIREVWWEIRTHPDFDAVQVRIRAASPASDEVTGVVAPAEYLVERLDREFDRGYTLPVPRGWVVRETQLRAARRDIDTEVIVDDRGTVVPEADVITDLVEDLMPTARRLGCSEQPSGREHVLAAGPSEARGGLPR